MTEQLSGENMAPLPPRRNPNGFPKLGGRLVRERREQLGWSQYELGERCDYNAMSVHNSETAKRAPSEAFVWRLVNALDLDPAVLFCAFEIVPTAASSSFFDVERMREALANGGAP